MNNTTLYMPPESVICSARADYTHRNYYTSPVAWLRRRRLKAALELGLTVGGDSAIDMGCADGAFLPTLSRHYASVTGVDTHAGYLESCASVALRCNIPNVFVTPHHDIARWYSLRPGKVAICYLLETIEHIGDSAATAWQDRVRFIREECLGHARYVVVSFPRMTGPLFVAKHLVQLATGAADRLTIEDVYRSLFGLTLRLEKRWKPKGGHVGFNDRKMMALLRERFDVVSTRSTLISRMALIRSAP